MNEHAKRMCVMQYMRVQQLVALLWIFPLLNLHQAPFTRMIYGIYGKMEKPHSFCNDKAAQESIVLDSVY